jgi:hypothetical protein
MCYWLQGPMSGVSVYNILIHRSVLAMLLRPFSHSPAQSNAPTSFQCTLSLHKLRKTPGHQDHHCCGHPASIPDSALAVSASPIRSGGGAPASCIYTDKSANNHRQPPLSTPILSYLLHLLNNKLPILRIPITIPRPLKPSHNLPH